ncbi:Putative phosphate-non-repressible acid phosphatase precursor [Podospora comata]|uniref:Phosphate-non-repressible acid phosphatase n=1 Tax=Podospora comata TaxID=48703 RepID=A0ABY6S4L0_PODCO|nr:Putative phosphate-non-repressible acid phosphatase precursor [Podospora comata]
MSATATYTMAELRAETQHGSLWSNYGNPVQMTGRFNPQDPSVPPPAPSHLVRPRSRQHTMDYPQYHHPRPGQEEGDGYDRYPHPSLMNIPSINSLKRPYSQVDQAPYTEMVQDLREDYKPSNHDQKLLSFKKVGDKHTIVDAKGRMHEMEIDAQLHGMFFLSEFPSAAGDGNVLNAELTCYRRNLFQISGSLCFPQVPLSVLLESGETSQIKNMEVSISAIESVDGHPVRLIVIPWKTPPPNSPEVNQAPDQEPPNLPLIPWAEDEDDTSGEHYAIYPIGWRRLQFRIATANNGRRKELQQHFVLHLKLHGTLANGQKLVLSELTTAPIVVRGRSPRNFQARKEIPLLGSSAGSRGQTLVETGQGIVAQAVVLNKPPHDARPRISSLDGHVPRGAFTFTAPKQMPQSPMQMRSNSYPTTWNPSSQVSMPHNPGSATYPTATMPSEPYPKLPLSGAPSYTAEPQEIPIQQTSMPSVQLSLVSQDQQPPPIRTQFATYVQATSAPPHLSLSTTADNSLNVPRYVDSNPRPSKSPRHASHQSVASSISNDTAPGEYRYGPPQSAYAANDMSPQSQHPSSAQVGPSQYGAPSQENNTSAPSSATAPNAPPPRDYFPSSQSWTTTAGEPSASSVSYNNGSSDRPYAFPSVKPESHQHGHQQQQHPHPPPPPGSHSSGAPGGVYGGVGHYAWNAT